MKPIDVNPHDLGIVLDVLRKHVPDREVLAFGSRVTWTAKEFSDLDLGIMGEQPLSSTTVAALKDELEESDAPFKVDVVDWATTSESFREVIRRDGVRITPSQSAGAGPSGAWSECTLGEVIELKRGYHLPQQERRSGSVPIVSSSGVSGFHNEAQVKGPGVVTGRYGTLGQVFYIGQDFWPLNTTLYVRNFKGNDPRFISYLLRSVDFLAYSDKAAVPGLNRNHLHQARVRLPVRVEEQRAIAHILGALDDKIDLNRRMNETLEAMARAIFRSWFVDFLPVRAKQRARTQTGDPVRAKAEGRLSAEDGAEAGDPSLPKPIADLFPDGFEDSEGGEIPAGWEVGTLADYAELNPESWSKESAPNEIEYVDLANTKWGKIEARQKYHWLNAPSRAQRILRPGDTIVGTVRPGNGSFAFISEPGLTGSTAFAVLRPRMPSYQELVYLAATMPENIERLSHLADGAAYPAVRPDVLLATQTVRPPDALVKRFALSTGSLMVKMAGNARETRTLAALRDALLPKLISGELRVTDADAIAARYA